MQNRIAAGITSLAFLAFCSPVAASSDSAWAAFDAKVSQACVAASGLSNYRASKIVGFDDRVGVAVMLISDKTRGSSLSKLCVYDKQADRAYVDDAEMWSAPPQPISEAARPMDEEPSMTRTEKGDRRYKFANGCAVVVDSKRAVIKSVDGSCKAHHQDIALLYAAGD